ncbi:MAG: hypothetical protein ACKVP0_13805 [Pirellulaceae bacterium]
MSFVTASRTLLARERTRGRLFLSLRDSGSSAQTELVRHSRPLTLVRNVFFAAIVLFHGFRRLLPPY